MPEQLFPVTLLSVIIIIIIFTLLLITTFHYLLIFPSNHYKINKISQVSAKHLLISA